MTKLIEIKKVEKLPSCHVLGCKACELGNGKGVKVVRSVLPVNSRIMVIAESPGEQENDQGVPLVGPSGQLFNEVLKEVNISRDELAIANAISCHPVGNKKPKPKELAACYTFLKAEIELIKPEVIVPMGNYALQQVLKGVGTITSMRGNWYDHPEFKCKVFPTYHPAYILRYMQERTTFVNDFRQVSNFLRGRENVVVKVETQYFIIKTHEQMEWLIDRLNDSPLWSCDTETTSLNPRMAEIFIITFSWSIGVAALLDERLFEDDKEYFWSKVKDIMSNNSKKIFQNASFDIQCFYHQKVYVSNYYVDTMLMLYLLEEEAANGHGLEVIAKKFTDLGGYDIPLEKYRKANKIKNYKDIPMEIIHPYSLCDADVTYRGFLAMAPMLTEQSLDFVNDEIMVPTSKILAYTEYNGVSIDIPYLKFIDAKYTTNMDTLFDSIMSVPEIQEFKDECKIRNRDKLKVHWQKSKRLPKQFPNFEDYLQSRLLKKPGLLDQSFNIRSDDQLRDFLINKMHLPVLLKTDTGMPSVNDAVLKIYALTNEFCLDLTEYRGLAHLKSTFIDGTLRRLEPDNKLHTHYLIHSTVTGRPSSRDPNLDNIPKTSTAEDIKDIFCGDWHTDTKEWDWLVEMDLGQVEFRVWMIYSQDDQAIRDLDVGIDIHKMMGAVGEHGVELPEGDISYQEFLVMVEGVTKLERDRAKRIVFGLMYGRGAAAIALQLGIPEEKAQIIIDAFFKRYVKAKRWLQRIVATAQRDGYVTNFFGRRRRLPSINTAPKEIRYHIENMAKNSPIQSAASDLVFLAMGRIIRQLWERGMESRLILTVYDSIVFNCLRHELEEVTRVMYYEMHNHPFDFINIPITADLKVGTHWGSLVEMDRNKPWDTEFGRISKIIAESDKKFLELQNIT